MPWGLVTKVLSTALNLTDSKVHDRGFFVPGYPVVVDSDSARLVEEVGEGL